jgi:hypothetical protein
VSALGIAVAMACGPWQADRTPPAGASLVLVDTVLLAEPDTAYVARAGGLAVGPNQLIYVADQVSARVYAYHRTGQLAGIVGRRGQGPGEFLQPLRIAFSGDSLLIVSDLNPRTLHLFRLPSLAPIREVFVEGILTDVQARNDTVFMAVARNAQNTGLAVLPAGKTVVEFRGMRPPRYRRWTTFERYVSPAAMALSGDTIAVAYSAYNGVFFYDLGGRLLGAVTLPAVRRRSISPNAGNEPLAGKTINTKNALFSTAYAATRLSSGTLAFVHFDFSYTGTSPSVQGFLSLLSADRKSACIDARIPLSQDSFGQAAFRGDTLFTVDQTVSDGSRARSVVRAYVISAASCTWIRTGSLIDD